jgi:hypothetical protein
MTQANRLDTIATRQRTGRVRDLLFVAAVAIASVVSITTLSTACHAATAPVHVAQR